MAAPVIVYQNAVTSAQVLNAKFNNANSHTPAVGNLVVFICRFFIDGGANLNEWTTFLTPGGSNLSIVYKIWGSGDTLTESINSGGPAGQWLSFEISGAELPGSLPASPDPIYDNPGTLNLPGDQFIGNTIGAGGPAGGPYDFSSVALTPAVNDELIIACIMVPQGTSPGSWSNGYNDIFPILSGPTSIYASWFSPANTGTTYTTILTWPGSGPYDNGFFQISFKPAGSTPPPPSTININEKLSQTSSFVMQVFRSGNWVDIPVRSAYGRIDKAKAGQMTVVLNDDQNDKYRSHLYEGEKIRAYKGVAGQPTVRAWTGFVDAPTITDEGEISRSVIVTDNMQELNTSVLLDGHIFDNLDPMFVCASVVQNAIDTKQYVPTDDSGNLLTDAITGFSTSAGNPLCYFPELFNQDGSPFVLASGQLGSYTSGQFAYASLMVPVASVGQNYLTYTLPNQYLIPSATLMIGSTMTLATSNVIPPASGQYVADYYNGVLYFNNANGGNTLYLSATYYQSPLWAFAPGTTSFDILSAIMDKSGCRWGVDTSGKFWSKFIDSTTAIKRVFNRGEYMNLAIQLNRDRRNVIVVEGWNPLQNQLIIALAVNYTDINSAPPVGLGKRQYMIIQDQSWKTQDAVNQAAYYASQQVGRRGKIKSVKIIDDPNINVEDCIGFTPAFQEVTPGDLFYVDSIEWHYEIPKGGGATINATLSGGSLPGQGLTFINALTANSLYGSTMTNSTVQGYAFQDVQPVASCSLTPPGGNYYSSFSIASGLTINYSLNISQNSLVTPDGHGGFILTHGRVKLEVYGSDGTYQLFTGLPNASGANTYSIPMGAFSPNVFYTLKMTNNDVWTDISIYRDFINSLP